MADLEPNQVNSLQLLLTFLDELDENKIFFRLDRCRSEAKIVRIDVPGERWEVEFFPAGEIEVEIFRSDEGVLGPEKTLLALRRLLDEHGTKTDEIGGP